MSKTETSAPDVVHPWEHRDALKRIANLEAWNMEMTRFINYLIPRFQQHLTVINEMLPNGPVMTAAILDDIEDAKTISKAGR